MATKEFSEIMQELDRILGQEYVPVLARPLIAATRFPCKNKIIGDDPEDPTMGPYEGPNLIHSIQRWYDAYYPKQVVLPDRHETRILSAVDQSMTSKTLKEKYKHNISKLLVACSSLHNDFETAMPYADRLSYGPEVRYERPQLSLAEILDKIDLAHAICNLVACLLIRREKESGDIRHV